MFVFFFFLDASHDLHKTPQIKYRNEFTAVTTEGAKDSLKLSVEHRSSSESINMFYFLNCP